MQYTPSRSGERNENASRDAARLLHQLTSQKEAARGATAAFTRRLLARHSLETSIHFIQQNHAKIIALNSPLSIFSFGLQQKLSRGQAKAPSFMNTFNRVCCLLIKCSKQLLVSPRLWEEGGITVLLFTSRVSLSSSHLIQVSQRERLLSKQRVGEICLSLCLSCSY